ncbi:MAG: SMP-30/gluconolactonase/LRE family protein [Dehalococcoidales bacterium]|nr:MAG: SMP-30/gluconolactonase/LRE family protein [Dehalococcoidales bacterium]
MRELLVRILDLPLWIKISIGLLVVLIPLVVLGILYWPPARVVWVEQPAMLHVLKGEVAVYANPDGEFIGSAEQTWLDAGNYIKAEDDSLAVLQYCDGSAVKIEGPAEVYHGWSRSMRGKALSEGRSISMEVLQGEVAASLAEPTSPRSSFNLKTPSSIGVATGNVFRVKVDETGEAIWEVTQGNVTIGCITPDSELKPALLLESLDAGYVVAVSPLPDIWKNDPSVSDRLFTIAESVVSKSGEKGRYSVNVKGASLMLSDAEAGLAVYRITEIEKTVNDYPGIPHLPHGYDVIEYEILDGVTGVVFAYNNHVIKPFFPIVPVPDIWYVAAPPPVRENPPAYLFSVYDIDKPLGVAVDPAGQRICVTQTGGDCNTLVYDSEGNHMLTLAPPRTAPAERAPSYVVIDQIGVVYVSDRMRHTIDMYDDEGAYLGTFTTDNGSGISWSPLGLAFDSRWNLFVTDLTDTKHRIMVFNPSGEMVLEFGQSGQVEGSFSFPNDVAVDSRGQIFVADSNNMRIQGFSSQGEFIGGFSSGGEEQVGFPRGIDIEGDYLYVVDTFDHKVKVFNIELGMESVFNFGRQGSGNGEFNFPNGLSLDAKGRIYIADRENNCVRVFGY